MRANLDKAYAKFTAEERLSLLVESAARRDSAESDRLWETAPLVSLQGPQPELSGKWTELDAFTSALVITLQSLISCFYAAYFLNSQGDSYANGWLEAGGSAKELVKREATQEPDREEIATALFERSKETASIAAAFDEACEAIGFSRDTLVRAFVSPPHAEQLELELEIVKHFARDGLDEQLKTETLDTLYNRHRVLFSKVA